MQTKTSTWLSAYDALPGYLLKPALEIALLEKEQAPVFQPGAQAGFVDGLATVCSSRAEGAQLVGGEGGHGSVSRPNAIRAHVSKGQDVIQGLLYVALSGRPVIGVGVVAKVGNSGLQKRDALRSASAIKAPDAVRQNTVKNRPVVVGDIQLCTVSAANAISAAAHVVRCVNAQGFTGNWVGKSDVVAHDSHLLLGGVVNQRTASGVRPLLILDADPCLFGAEVLATDDATGCALNLGAVLSGDAPGAFPVGDGSFLQTKEARQLFLATQYLCRFFNGFCDMHDKKYRTAKQNAQRG